MSSNTNNSDNNNNKIPLIFIHGIKGSTLVDEQEKLYYLNFWQAISLSSPQIALPLEWKDGKQKTDGLKAGKILDKVAYVKVYGPFLDYLKTLGRPIYPFAYDWRRDLNETVEKFQTFIRKVYADHNCKVQLVAHSMGGLVTLASINTHHGVLVGEPVTNLPDRDNVQPKSGDPETVATQSEVEQGESSEKKQTTNFVSENVKKGDERVIDIVHSVVYAGCPFRTGVGFLRDLMVGTPTGYNNKILSPSVLYTFPSLYTFFPTDENSQILDENENFVPINFYDYQDWVNYKMGIFYHVSKPTEEQLEHVRYCTIQAKLLRSKLVALKDVNYPPCAVLASHKHVTERRYKRVNEKLDFSAPITAMGDDRIVNALPPDGIQCKEYETDEAHAGLLNDIPKTNQIISDLLSIVQ